MGSCSSSPPPISHLLPTNNNKTHPICKQSLIVSSLTTKALELRRRRGRIQRRQLLVLLSVPVSLSLCSSGVVLAASIFDPLTKAERAASNEVTRRVEEAVDLLEKGRDFQANGDYAQALQYFTQ
ncbi:hypothetical protein Tco_1487508, partial [Tanacetum coccineum]